MKDQIEGRRKPTTSMINEARIICRRFGKTPRKGGDYDGDDETEDAGGGGDDGDVGDDDDDDKDTTCIL